ncbi:NAD(P)H-binding protein [Nocardiopsis alba]|uniref:NAD(P)H-binding protein n=1 Tax=Nocardiopsis alba TaxID=53437 RepID=A0A7K2ISV5_9ACTN|nr:NAD(P)H-binding protein [Nocardiopsis alba]MYR32865.1 NAD(P)H-binding protein [Nocardiopsis alba]
MTAPVLVTGATGNTGRHVVAGLLAEGIPVRAMTRDPERAALPAGAEIVRGRTTDPEDVAAAAEGASAVYLVWPGTDDEAKGAAEVVEALGGRVPRVVYLSAQGAEEGGVWGAVETLVRRNVPEWTFLRVSGLATNTLLWVEGVRRGVVEEPFGRARRSLVHEKDVAAMAVRALVDPDHVGRAYTVTGPESIGQAEQVRVIGEVIGRETRWVEQSPEEARDGLVERVGEEFADQLLSHWSANVDVVEPVSQDVPRVLGRPALTYREWVGDHRADFAPEG